MKSKVSKVIMTLTILIYAIFNILYIISAKGDIQCFGASMLFKGIGNEKDKILNLILFLCFTILLIITYIMIVLEEKNSNIEDFNKTNNNKINIKGTIIFIAIISVLSGIILPNNSSDVYYYMAVGRLDSKYNQDMFETNFKEEQPKYEEDKIISSSPAWDQKFTYGVVFGLICKIIGAIPASTPLVPLYAFKLLNIIVHLLNCYLIYKISKNKKLVLLYGLNPLVIFEGIINCHNDIFLILSILLAVYLKKQNKTGLAVLSIAIGTLIKYTPIIFLPYIVYEKGKTLIQNKKINKEYLWQLSKYVIEFILIFIIINLIFLGDIRKILEVGVQTKRFANSIYVQMLMMGANWKVINASATIGKILFCIIFFEEVVIRQRKEAKYYVYFTIAFLALVITNFRIWYIMWLFGVITELDKENVIKVVALTIIALLTNYIMYYFGESYIYGGFYFMSIATLFAMFVITQVITKRISSKNIN